MKTNLNKKELKRCLNELMNHVQEVGTAVGNDELNYMTDVYRDQYAEFEGKLETLIAEIDNLQ